MISALSKKILTTFLIVSSPAFTVLPTDGLTAHWSFGSNFKNSSIASGNTDPVDSARLNLEPIGVVSLGPSLFGQAAQFDGDRDYLRFDPTADTEVVEGAPLSNKL